MVTLTNIFMDFSPISCCFVRKEEKEVKKRRGKIGGVRYQLTTNQIRYHVRYTYEHHHLVQ
jgi:hypothetical protein